MSCTDYDNTNPNLCILTLCGCILRELFTITLFFDDLFDEIENNSLICKYFCKPVIIISFVQKEALNIFKSFWTYKSRSPSCRMEKVNFLWLFIVFYNHEIVNSFILYGTWFERKREMGALGWTGDRRREE